MLLQCDISRNWRCVPIPRLILLANSPCWYPWCNVHSLRVVRLNGTHFATWLCGRFEQKHMLWNRLYRATFFFYFKETPDGPKISEPAFFVEVGMVTSSFQAFGEEVDGLHGYFKACQGWQWRHRLVYVTGRPSVEIALDGDWRAGCSKIFAKELV